VDGQPTDAVREQAAPTGRESPELVDVDGARPIGEGYRRRAASDLPTAELSWYTRLHAARILLDIAHNGETSSDHPYAMLTGPALSLVRA
jgi:hypothetical protein